jgi:hypothetical protein
MRTLHGRLAWVCGLLLAIGSLSAWAEEAGGGPPAKGAKGGPRAGGLRNGGQGAGLTGGGPGGMQRPGGADGPRMPFSDLPAVQEELKRHAEALRELLTRDGELRDAVREEVKTLVQEGKGEDAIAAAIKAKVGDKAKAIAAKVAAEMVQHHENMAKIFQQEGIADKLADSIIQRLAKMAANRGERAAGKGAGGEGAKGPRPEGKGAAPDNF